MEIRMIPRWGICGMNLLEGRNCDFSLEHAEFDL